MSKLLVAAAGLAVAGVASASQPYDLDGAGFAIVDLADMGSSVSVATPSQILGVSINMQHTWVGDLTITLSGAEGSVTLLDRPGVPASTFGSSSDMNGIYTFQDGFAPIPEAPANPVPTGTYGPAAGSFASLGTVGAGSWTLTINDGAGGDTGQVISWTLHLKKIPAPGAAALAGLAGLAGLRRRR